MLHREPLLVILLKLIDGIPWPQESAQRRRGRPTVYSERLIVKALVIMIIRRLYTAYSCLLYTSPSPRDRTRSRMPSSA